METIIYSLNQLSFISLVTNTNVITWLCGALRFLLSVHVLVLLCEGLLQISPVERGVVTLLGVRSGLFVAMSRRGKLYGSVSSERGLSLCLSVCLSLSFFPLSLLHSDTCTQTHTGLMNTAKLFGEQYQLSLTFLRADALRSVFFLWKGYERKCLDYIRQND